MWRRKLWKPKSGRVARPVAQPAVWVAWVNEPVPGYPQRPIPRDEDAPKALRKRTLTSLYPPQWLVDAHEALDAAVAATYGWSADIRRRRDSRHIAVIRRGRPRTRGVPLEWSAGSRKLMKTVSFSIRRVNRLRRNKLIGVFDTLRAQGRIRPGCL